MHSPRPTPVATLANWQEPPYNRWAFQHVRELIPTARIERSPEPRPLPAGEPIDLARLALPDGDGPRTAAQALAESHTSGFLVLHEGRVRAEHYGQGLTPSRPHLLMSVSKSMVATVAGILAGRGLLAPDTAVVDVLPELRGTDWEGAAVRHLLDMRAGTRFDEDYANLDADVRVYEQVYLWRPRTIAGLPEDGPAYMAGLRNKRPHGGPFDYRSVLTDMLGWVLERAAGRSLAELLEQELWWPMGAEFDADLTVDAHGNALGDGGVCCTLRDLARFGQLWLDRGVVGGRQVIPQSWIRDTLEGGPDSREAFLAGGQRTYRGGFYRNKLWILDPELPLFAGFGINGQAVYVHAPARLVVAKLSAWPGALDEGFEAGALATVKALAEAVA